MSRKWHSFSQNGTQAASRTVSWMCAMPLISIPMVTVLRAPRRVIQVSLHCTPRRHLPTPRPDDQDGRTMIDLYYWPTPNGWKASIMLEECGLAYRTIPVDLGGGEQFK